MGPGRVTVEPFPAREINEVWWWRTDLGGIIVTRSQRYIYNICIRGGGGFYDCISHCCISRRLAIQYTGDRL